MTAPEGIDDRIAELRERTALSPREAEVQAWKENGHTHEQIARRLELDKSTVDEYSRRVRAKHEEAVQTIKEINVDKIEARCLSCGQDVEDQPILADFPICETCFRQLWTLWFEHRVRVNIQREEMDLMIDKRIKFLDGVNRALINDMAKDLSESRDRDGRD